MREPPNCAILRTLAVFDDLWSLGILRCVFYGDRRFTRIQAELGVAPNILSDRLRHLVEAGILRKEAYQERPLRHEYQLTAAGQDLAPVFLALRQWGLEHLPWQVPLPPLAHRDCGGTIVVQATCSECGAEVAAADVAMPGS